MSGTGWKWDNIEQKTSGDAATEPEGRAEAKEVARTLSVAERLYSLYPLHSRVVQEAVDKLLISVHRFFASGYGTLELEIGPRDIRFEGALVLSDPEKSRGIAQQLHQDSVRRITIVQGVSADELVAFVSCFRELQNIREYEEEFQSIFWAKDCAHIEVFTSEDFVDEDEFDDLFDVADPDEAIQHERFQVSEAELSELREQAIERQHISSGPNAPDFQLSDADVELIKQQTLESEEPYPVATIVDLLLEVIVLDVDSQVTTAALASIEPTLSDALRRREFDEACLLIRKLKRDRRGLSVSAKLFLRELIESLGNATTFEVLRDFLSKSPKLSPEHSVFEFMKLVGRDLAPQYFEFLKVEHQQSGVVGVLAHFDGRNKSLATGSLTSASAAIAKGAIKLIVQVDRPGAARRLLPALRHPDESVRLTTARTLLDLRDSSAANALLEELYSENKKLVALALRFFSSVPCSSTFDGLIEFAESRTSYDFGVDLQRLLYEALLRSNPTKAQDYLAGSVLKKSLLTSRASRTRREAGLRALEAEPCPQGIAILRDVAASRRDPLHTIARGILRRLGKESEQHDEAT